MTTTMMATTPMATTTMTATDEGAPGPVAGGAPSDRTTWPEPTEGRAGDPRPRTRQVRSRSPRTWWVRARQAAGTGDLGMATAEYAIATVAAAGFAGLLLLILRSDEVRGALLSIVRGALSV